MRQKRGHALTLIFADENAVVGAQELSEFSGIRNLPRPTFAERHIESHGVILRLSHRSPALPLIVRCPLYSQKRTLLNATRMSALCQKQTSCALADGKRKGDGICRPLRVSHPFGTMATINRHRHQYGVCRSGLLVTARDFRDVANPGLGRWRHRRHTV